VTPPSVPSKPTVQLNRAALSGLGLKGLPVKPDLSKVVTKPTTAAAAMDDFAESGRKLVKLGDMPPVDLALTEGSSVGENLEGEEDEEENPTEDVIMKAPDEEEEEDVDPLDAFMTDVVQEVKKVNAQDRIRLKGSASRLPIDGAAEEDTEDIVQATAVDDLDTTDMRPEDILA
jgi:ATP-dependent RNA helicase DDX46/PRP5